MRLVVFGAGGVGGYFGGRLAAAGEDVTFIARGEHLRAMRSAGLKVESPDGDFRLERVRATDDPSEAGEADVIVLCVKAWQAPEAARAMRPLVAQRTTVLPLQNGVDAPAQLASELGAEHVLGGLCKIVSYVVAPGRIRHAGFAPSVVLGELDDRRSERVEEITRAFRRAGVEATVADDIHAAMWMKFLFIASYSGVGTVARATAGPLRTVPETRALVRRAMEEVYAVARARGVKMPHDSVEKSLAAVDALPADATASMQRDVVAGRPSELEAQSGAVVRLGREAGVEVPTHEFIYGALKPLELKARGELIFG